MRGQGAQLIICDEIMFWPADLFDEIIIPLATQKNTAVIMISSPPKSYNFAYAMMDLKDEITGEPLIISLKHTLVCNNCQRLEHPEECPHLLHENPPWKNVDATSVARQLYRGDTKLMMAETMGAMQAGGGLIFSSAHIDRMAANAFTPWLSSFPDPEFIFIACDPNAGADDHTAIVAITQLHGTFYVRVPLSVSVPVVPAPVVVLRSGPPPLGYTQHAPGTWCRCETSWCERSP